MKCEIRFFGMIAEKLNLQNEEINLDTDISDLQDLKKSIIAKYPSLEGMTFTIAVDGVLTNTIRDKEIKTIAVLPPFAGG
jgi:molybdopterin converting factor small subunit